MRTLTTAIILILFTINALNCQTDESDPKAIPAFDFLIDFDKVRDFNMTADGKEAYFTIQSSLEELSAIAVILKVNNEWTQPQIASFSGIYKDLEAFLAPNGLSLYFVSNRPINKASNETRDYDIWYVKRASKSSKWSEPVNMGAPINSEHNEFYPSISSNGNLYFTSDAPQSKGLDDIFFSQWTEDGYTAPKSMSDSINTEGYEYNSYISPDESFLMFGAYNRVGGYGSGDIYISHKNKSGVFEKAQLMAPPVNSKFMDYCPFVDFKGNMLFFTSRRSSIKEINEFSNIDDFMRHADSYENGHSRIYKLSMDNIKELRTN